MSLIRVRRERKRNWIDTKKTRSTRRMLLLLAALAVAGWYLSRTFQ